MSELSQLRCVSLRGGEPALSSGEVYRMQPQVPDWKVQEVGGMQRLVREFKFKDFAQALAFTDKVGAIAEQEDHHPLIVTEWGKVTVNWWTHKIGGLHKNDFIMAARTDELYHQ